MIRRELIGSGNLSDGIKRVLKADMGLDSQVNRPKRCDTPTTTAVYTFYAHHLQRMSVGHYPRCKRFATLIADANVVRNTSSMRVRVAIKRLQFPWLMLNDRSHIRNMLGE